jgi:integrase
VPDPTAPERKRQRKKLLGLAWTGKGRPQNGYLTRKMAEDQLQAILTDARRGAIDNGRPVGHTLNEACEEWLRYVEHDRGRRFSTVRDYRNTINKRAKPYLGADTLIATITTDDIDALRERLLAEGELSRRSVQKTLVLLHAVFKRAKRRKWIATNPVEDAERVTLKRSGEFHALEPAEVFALARAAEGEQDAALFTVAAFTGLRMGELRALRWRDVDFATLNLFVRKSFVHGSEYAPKSGKVRSVPLIDEAARVLDQLSQREHFTQPDDLVFVSTVGGHLDDVRLRRRFYKALKKAKLPRLRFHDLRHTFGTMAVKAWDLPKVQGYMGHADIQTTMIYVHHVPKHNDVDALNRVVGAATSQLVGVEAEASAP